MLLVCSLLFRSCFVGALILFFILLRTQLGDSFSFRTFCKWCSSSSNSCWVEHTALALWCKVLTTLYFTAMVWWLSHCRYKSVWVGFPVYPCAQVAIWTWSDQGVQKGHGPIFSAIFHSELDLLIYGVDMADETFFLGFLDDDKSVINKSSPQTRGCWWCVDSFFLKCLHV